MNYINNPNTMCCCSFDHGDFIVGRKVCELGNVTPGHSYDCEDRWALIKNYVVIAYYPTEAAAKNAYDKLVDEFAIRGHVFTVLEGKA